MSSTTITFFILAVLPLIVARPVQRSSSIPLQPDFDFSKFAGKWFDIYRSPAMIWEKGTDNHFAYSLRNDGKISVQYSDWRDGKWYLPKPAYAWIPDVNQPAAWLMKFSWFMPAGDFRILYTDYNDVAVIYGEQSIFGFRVNRYAWIFGRNNKISQEVEDYIFNLLNERTGMQKSDLVKSTQGVAPSSKYSI